MAAARGIVATTNGATGVDLTDGRELLIADTPDEFADAILTLLIDPQRRAEMGQAARTRANELLNWDALGEELAAVYAQTALIAATSGDASPLPVQA
jgi:glycosyltransferase involved in cell wall biosynthesis